MYIFSYTIWGMEIVYFIMIMNQLNMSRWIRIKVSSRSLVLSYLITLIDFLSVIFKIIQLSDTIFFSQGDIWQIWSYQLCS